MESIPLQKERSSNIPREAATTRFAKVFQYAGDRSKMRRGVESFIGVTPRGSECSLFAALQVRTIRLAFWAAICWSDKLMRVFLNHG